jgi:hypothetical protein
VDFNSVVTWKSAAENGAGASNLQADFEEAYKPVRIVAGVLLIRAGRRRFRSWSGQQPWRKQHQKRHQCCKIKHKISAEYNMIAASEEVGVSKIGGIAASTREVIRILKRRQIEWMIIWQGPRLTHETIWKENEAIRQVHSSV